MSNIVRTLGLATLIAVSAFAVGCGGNVCEDAAEICKAAGNGGSSEGECTGAAETVAKCIVDKNSCTLEALGMCSGG
jgi:hypothetical protein